MLKAVLGQNGRPARDSAVQEFLRYARQREADLSTARVATVGKRLAFAVVPMPAPGGTGMLLCPDSLGTGIEPELVTKLICEIRDDQFRSGAKILQVLLPVPALEVRGIFERSGFVLLAELIYLHRSFRGSVKRRDLSLPPGLALATFTPEARPQFIEAIQRSYITSLDCPALSGKRSIDDVILSHQAAGEFRNEWWHVLHERDSGRPLGVLLLSGIGDGAIRGLELVYLGLVPEARGRGLGDLLMRLASQHARLSPGGTLTLAVDAVNRPALSLYARHGMKRIQRRVALMCLSDDADTRC